MIDRKQLLSELQSLLTKTIEPDLRERSDLPEIAAALTAEFETAKKAERTALNYTDWRSDYITQIGVSWVLSCVFIRFLEDNRLIDPPKLSGPAKSDGDSQTSLQRARDEYDLYIKANPTHSFREYILSVVDQLAKLPGVSDVFGDKNIIHQQRDWLSNDAAKVLYNFWQKIVPETGQLIHNFVDDLRIRNLRHPLPGRSVPGSIRSRPQEIRAAANTRLCRRVHSRPNARTGTRRVRPTTPVSGEALSRRSSDPSTYFKMIDPACGSVVTSYSARFPASFVVGSRRNRAPKSTCWCSGRCIRFTESTSTPSPLRSPVSACCWPRSRLVGLSGWPMRSTLTSPIWLVAIPCITVGKSNRRWATGLTSRTIFKPKTPTI